MKKHTPIFLALASLVVLSGLAGVVVAQGSPAVTPAAPAPAPSASSPRAAAPSVAPAPSVTPPAIAPAPTTVAAPGLPNPAVGVPVMTAVPSPAPSTMPVTSLPSIDAMDDDDLVRRLARVNAQRGVVQAEASLDQARLSSEAASLEGQIKILELRNQVANGGKKPEERAPGGAGAPASTPAQAAAILAYQAPQPAVRSIYGYGTNGYAEIYVGTDKVVATPGTVLSTGHRVVNIGPNGVVVVKNGRRQTLPVRGSAGTLPAIPTGLPPMPPAN